ncbi:hypothetical protein LS684_06215 [Cytobacillus spongiae]|uniref:UPF0738 family protein n=1 Tax=Cytobacillus spongiae TaxID=2901381 RepID=UPI001F213FEA|nr:hypothetical protein [Cytobacillus spongiae]UII57031.1 hypothetical protein LS684_06215 [Cytobacillus spongiae]
MRQKRQMTKSIQIENTEVQLITNDPIENLTATGKMLVDSDQFSFVYITEQNDDYIYISLTEAVWSDLKSALDLELPVVIVHETERLELSDFHEELSYLIENIKGNSNYGEEMVAKVENTF